MIFLAIQGLQSKDSSAETISTSNRKNQEDSITQVFVDLLGIRVRGIPVAESKNHLRTTLELTLSAALTYLEGLDHNPVGATVDLSTLRRRFDRPLGLTGVSPEQVVEDLVRDVEGGILGSTGGRFFGWVIGGSLTAALAADWLTATWDQNAALYACGPAAAVVEEVVGGWLKELMGLPRHASFALTTGCQMAHVTCLAAARHALLARKGWDVEQKGLSGAPPLRILSSTERHGSIDRAVRLLGIGREQVTDLPADEQGRIVPTALKEALAGQAKQAASIIVLLQAGDINIGAYDDFEQLVPLARQHGAWVHVDGAFGLWANTSAKFRHLLSGASGADSWATDGHKWLNVPYDCGYSFVADHEAHRAAMSHRAPYITHDESARDQIDWNPEWSRRGRGFPTYAALRQLGKQGVAELIERSCAHASSLVLGMGSLPGTEVLSKPTLNQGLVRFLDSAAGATEEDHDRRTDAVVATLMATGEAFFGGTTWRGRRAMRVSVCNWRTTESDVKRAIGAVESILKTPAPALD
jgi:glutamate/tyrosine decarboxylase-like PLP-dependent enzyme